MFFFSFLILFPTFVFSQNVDYQKMSNEPKWIKLLHYKKNFFGGWESQADGQGFFLHPEGKTNPEKELKRSIELFSRINRPTNKDPACRFPLRLKWLNQKLGGPWRVDLSGCENYIGFFSKVAAKRATIVFSSYYLGNPNTAFGHTLLRLSRYDDKSETEMLDYGINYAAEARGTNPFIYAFKGLFGGFKGHFAALPYYYKIREYSNYEFRDLWSYDLKLTMPQVLEMVDHIWELGQTDFDYYYFTENCSYHLLSLLEVVMPEKDLTGQYHLFAIPADTVRLLKQRELIDEGKIRESTYSKLIRISKPLKQDELDAAKSISIDPKDTFLFVKRYDDETAAKILDVSLEAFDYNNAQDILIDDPKTKELKEHILKERARNPIVTDNLDTFEFSQKASPANGHAPTRWALSQGYQDRVGAWTQLEVRPALHDLLDPSAGSLRSAQLEVGKTAVSLQDYRYSRTHLQLDSLSVFTIKNYPEQNFWASPLSWEMDLGAKQTPRVDCLNCPMGFVNGSMGNSFQLGSRFLMAILLNGEMDFHRYFKQDYRLGLGPKVFTRYSFSDKFLMGLEAYYHFNTYATENFFSDHDLFIEVEARYHLNDKFSFMMKFNGREYKDWTPGGQVGLQYFY